MGFSSFRKAAPRPEHKERSQLSRRSRLGLLEKHKDYVLRARNYHSKEKRLLALREKARLRNPDEFYFGMQSNPTQNGIHWKKKSNSELSSSFSNEMIALMKSQDLKYISSQRHMSDKKLKKLKELYPLLYESIQSSSSTEEDQERFILNDPEAESPSEKNQKKRNTNKKTKMKKLPKHIIFEDDENMEMDSENIAKTELISCNYDNITSNNSNDQNGLKKLLLKGLDKKEISRVTMEIKSRQKRDDQLKKVEKELILQKLLSGKGKRRKIGIDKDGIAKYQWSQERKR